MRILITGSAGHLGEALMRTMQNSGHQAIGLDIKTSPSTTSAFVRALTPPEGAPAAWITEEVVPVPKNIYGVTKVAAENLCELIHHKTALPCLVLRTSRFFLFEAEYGRRGWTMPQNIHRVYVNELARTQLD